MSSSTTSQTNTLDTADFKAFEATLAVKEARLRDLVSGLGRVLVAYSGGVDSSVVAKIASEALPPQAMVAVISTSPSLPESEYLAAAKLAKEHNIPLRTIQTQEMLREGYRANSSRRCYYCKSELYSDLQTIMKTEHYDALLDGANLDDQNDHRPGREAARENGVRSPLQETGFTKRDVRALALKLNLPNHDKPASPCLASRIPYGLGVTVKALKQIEAAEDFLKKRFSLKVLRVRYHDKLARIEVPRENIPNLLSHADEIHTQLRSLGFAYVTIDLLGFRSGSLNEGLAPSEKYSSSQSREAAR